MLWVEADCQPSVGFWKWQWTCKWIQTHPSLVAAAGWRLFYSDLSSATVQPAEFLWEDKRRGRKQTGCNFLGICICLGGKKLRAKCGQLGRKQKAQQSHSSAKKKREKKKERKEEFMLLLWSQIEVFRCSTWRALGKVSEMAGTVRTSATTDGGFHTATFFYIRWINVTVPDPEHGCKWRGRRTSLSAAMSSEMSSAATYRNPASAEISQRNEILCSSDNPDQASGPLLFPEEPFEKVSSSAEIRSTSALETEKTDPHTSLETTHKEVNGLTDQFNKTALAPTDL